MIKRLHWLLSLPYYEAEYNAFDFELVVKYLTVFKCRKKLFSLLSIEYQVQHIMNSPFCIIIAFKEATQVEFNAIIRDYRT
jgi:hypothetical protein